MATTALVTAFLQCDIGCGGVAQYDAATKFGPWAYLCEICFEEYTTGQLGTGFGQRLQIDKG